jgi:hypothetical protein
LFHLKYFLNGPAGMAYPPDKKSGSENASDPPILALFSEGLIASAPRLNTIVLPD